MIGVLGKVSQNVTVEVTLEYLIDILEAYGYEVTLKKIVKKEDKKETE